MEKKNKKTPVCIRIYHTEPHNLRINFDLRKQFFKNKYYVTRYSTNSISVVTMCANDNKNKLIDIQSAVQVTLNMSEANLGHNKETV